MDLSSSEGPLSLNPKRIKGEEKEPVELQKRPRNRKSA